MTELIPAARVEEVLRHFREHSHVGVAGVYPPELADATIRELDAIADPYEPGATGETKATIIACKPAPDRPHSTEVLSRIETYAQILGVSLWPATRGETSIIDLIRMEPGTRGQGHKDTHSLVELVAIGTLQGCSALLLEGGSDYTLQPGDVAYHDPERQMWHQGVAGPVGERVGIVVAKELRRPISL